MNNRINVFHPQFTWHTPPTVSQLEARLIKAPSTPSLRPLTSQWWQQVIGFLHQNVLIRLSKAYCKWWRIPCPGQIWPLPFGLVLKKSDGTRIEEVVTTRAIYETGIPVPKIISYGLHPKTPHAPVSILMTRLPGMEMDSTLWNWFTQEEKDVAIRETKIILNFLRQWGRSSAAPDRASVCSILGTSIRSFRVPNFRMPPCSDEAEFNERLMAPARKFPGADYATKIGAVEELEAMKHNVVFTHGDIAYHNIFLMEDGRIGGILDWEAAGYYPEYWEYTSALRWVTNGWWYDFVKELAEGRYEEEWKRDGERWHLTEWTMVC